MHPRFKSTEVFFFDNSKQNINFAKKKLSKLTATAFALYNHDYNHGQC